MNPKPDLNAKLSTVAIMCMGLGLIALLIELGVIYFFKKSLPMWWLPLAVQLIFSFETWYRTRDKPHNNDYRQALFICLGVGAIAAIAGCLMTSLNAYWPSLIGAGIMNWTWFSAALKHGD